MGTNEIDHEEWALVYKFGKVLDPIIQTNYRFCGKHRRWRLIKVLYRFPRSHQGQQTLSSAQTMAYLVTFISQQLFSIGRVKWLSSAIQTCYNLVTPNLISDHTIVPFYSRASGGETTRSHGLKPNPGRGGVTTFFLFVTRQWVFQGGYFNTCNSIVVDLTASSATSMVQTNMKEREMPWSPPFELVCHQTLDY